MSGIYGFVGQNSVSDPDSVLKRMREAIPPYGPSIEREWARKEGDVGLGALHPARIHMPGHYAENQSVGVYCVFDGIIYRDSAAPGESLVEPDGAALLLDRYLESGVECLSQFNGSFNVAWWDERARRLVLANDKIGQRLLFYGHRNGMFAFASLLARVTAADLMAPEIDVEAFADLISYNYVIGERTLFQDVKILPPASVLKYERGQVEIRKYWDLGEIETYGKYDEQRLDELEELFKMAVRRSIRPDITMAIDLTGGLDSRCMLAAAANMQLPFITHTGGLPDSTDVVLAQQAAEMVGAKHFFEPVGPERAAERLDSMVWHQGGIIATLHSHPCQHFDMPLPFDASAQGIGINYIRGYWLSASDLDIDTPLAMERFLKRKILSNATKQIDLEGLWRQEFHKAGLQAPDEHLKDLFGQYQTQDQPIAVLDNISLHERCRKFLNKAIIIVRAAREIYYPYFDHELLVALAKIPMAERLTNKIQVDLIKRLFPKLLDVPSAKKLVPMSVSPTRVWMTHKSWAVRRRMARWFGVPNTVPAKVPTHYYSQWIRNEMRPKLVELLYNPNAAFRAYLRWESVETLLEQHFSGKKNWEQLVAALTVFEIAHQLWVDPD